MKRKLQCLLYGKEVVTYHSLCVVIFRRSPGGGDYLLRGKSEINPSVLSGDETKEIVRHLSSRSVNNLHCKNSHSSSRLI